MQKLFFILLSFVSLSLSASDQFRIGADNSDQAISNLTELTGLTIEEIEDRARPCEFSSHKDICADSGFLGKDERLITRLIYDNQLIHSKKLTHQDLAKPLSILSKLDSKFCKSSNATNGRCSYNNMQYEVTIQFFFGYQLSIFNDNLKSNTYVTAKNLTTNEILEFDGGIVPEYIRRYGFYEGDTEYRLDPLKVISFFGL